MKKILSSLVMAFFLFGMIPSTLGAGTSFGIGIGYEWELSAPLIFADPDSRILVNTPEQGNQEIERVNNYAFEGERVIVDVLGVDCNGKEKIADVFGYAHPTDPNAGYEYKEVNCYEISREEPLSSIGVSNCGETCCQDPDIFNPATMQWYRCEFTVETPNSMQGEHWLDFGILDNDGLEGNTGQTEYWYFNPVIEMQVSGDLNFDNPLSPGQTSTSNTLLIEGGGDAEAGVVLYVETSGEDFYDPTSSGGMCPTSNVMSLNTGGTQEEQNRCDGDIFCYKAIKGSYSTNDDTNRADVSGFVGIPYETGDPDDRVPIITGPNNNQHRTQINGEWYYLGSMLPSGGEISYNLRLDIPVPCNGGPYTDGQILFWGTAI